MEFGTFPRRSHSTWDAVVDSGWEILSSGVRDQRISRESIYFPSALQARERGSHSRSPCTWVARPSFRRLLRRATSLCTQRCFPQSSIRTLANASPAKCCASCDPKVSFFGTTSLLTIHATRTYEAYEGGRFASCFLIWLLICVVRRWRRPSRGWSHQSRGLRRASLNR